MNGLRSFIDSDNHRVVEVGHLRRGPRPFKVKIPKVSEDRSEVLRESNEPLRGELRVVRMTTHRVSVVSFKDQVSFGVCHL